MERNCPSRQDKKSPMLLNGVGDMDGLGAATIQFRRN